MRAAFETEASEVSLPFFMAFTRRLIHMAPGSVIDLALLKAARDAKASDYELMLLRNAIANDIERRR